MERVAYGLRSPRSAPEAPEFSDGPNKGPLILSCEQCDAFAQFLLILGWYKRLDPTCLFQGGSEKCCTIVSPHGAQRLGPGLAVSG